LGRAVIKGTDANHTTALLFLFLCLKSIAISFSKFHIFKPQQMMQRMQGYTNNQNTALLFLRIVTAVIFYVAAYVKFAFWSHAPEGISPFMLFTTRLLSIAEPLGATAVLIGFLTRLASVGLIIILLGAIYVSQFVYGIGFVMPTAPGWNFPLSVLAACFILLAFGPGEWSVDRMRAGTSRPQR